MSKDAIKKYELFSTEKNPRNKDNTHFERIEFLDFYKY